MAQWRGGHFEGKLDGAMERWAFYREVTALTKTLIICCHIAAIVERERERCLPGSKASQERPR